MAAISLAKKHTDPQSFGELLEKRYKEYSHYPMRMLKENESQKGELFWEFGKNISAVICGFEHPVFGISLSNLMLEAFVEWKGLSELLPE